MDKKVGAQIKEWEVYIAILMTAGFVILDLVILYFSYISDELFIGFLAVLVCSGCGFFWIRTVRFLLYGYGELLECVRSIREELTERKADSVAKAEKKKNSNVPMRKHRRE